MNNTTCIGLSILIGYLFGCINPAFLLAKLKGFDIRTKGSGNPGASNAMLILGKKAGVFCALFDIFKSFAAFKICAYLFPTLETAGLIAGVCCILGHMYPVFMKFKGGKGLASAAGLILAYDLKVFGIFFVGEVAIALITNYISLMPTSGSLLFMIFLYVTQGPVYALIYLPVVVVIWIKHIVNFKRIRYGVEVKIKSFWDKKNDKERVRKNWEKLADEQKLYVDMKEYNY